MKILQKITVFFILSLIQSMDLQASNMPSSMAKLATSCLTTIGNNKINTLLTAASVTNVLLDIKFSCSSISTTEEKILLLYSGLAGLCTVGKLLNKNSAFDPVLTCFGLFCNLGSFRFRSWGYDIRADELNDIKKCSDSLPVNLTAPYNDTSRWAPVSSNKIDTWLNRNNCPERQAELIKILCTVDINNVKQAKNFLEKISIESLQQYMQTLSSQEKSLLLLSPLILRKDFLELILQSDPSIAKRTIFSVPSSRSVYQENDVKELVSVLSYAVAKKLPPEIIQTLLDHGAVMNFRNYTADAGIDLKAQDHKDLEIIARAFESYSPELITKLLPPSIKSALDRYRDNIRCNHKMSEGVQKEDLTILLYRDVYFMLAVLQNEDPNVLLMLKNKFDHKDLKKAVYNKKEEHLRVMLQNVDDPSIINGPGIRSFIEPEQQDIHISFLQYCFRNKYWFAITMLLAEPFDTSLQIQREQGSDKPYLDLSFIFDERGEVIESILEGCSAENRALLQPYLDSYQATLSYQRK